MTDVSFRPLHDRIVVRRVEAEANSNSGIIIPDTARESLGKMKCWPSFPAALTTGAN